MESITRILPSYDAYDPLIDEASEAIEFHWLLRCLDRVRGWALQVGNLRNRAKQQISNLRYR